MRRIVLLLSIALAARSAGAVAPTTQADDAGVRLVVLLVIDQFRTDFLTRFEQHFADDGFRRLTRDGATFVNAYFSNAATVTAPGHATIATGRLPRQHGIVANQWYLDPSDRKPEAAYTDGACEAIGAGAGEKAKGRSPRMLIGPTLGDEMKLADGRTRVFSIATKPRAAIGMGGHRPDGCYWWTEDTGRWLTSSYYADRLPPCLAAWNEQAMGDRFAGATWQRLLPEGAYAGCLPAATDGRELLGLGAAFPHALPGRASKPTKRYYEALEATPFAQEMTFELAGRIVQDERLGRGPAVDLLCVSLSAFDVCGHIFGPDSAEIMDFTLQSDRQIAAFLAMLDQAVGRGRYLVALTGDHGVATPPPVAERLGLDAGYVDLGDLRQRLNDALRDALGSLPDESGYVRDIEPPWVFLNPVVDRMDHAQRARVFNVALGVIRATRGLVNGFTADELSGPPPPPSDVPRWLAYRAYYPGRSGHIALQFATYWQKKSKDLAGHAGGSNHERHVPIVLFGPGVRCGRFFSPADPLDIAPTLAALLGIEPPAGASGRVLHEALDASPR